MGAVLGGIVAVAVWRFLVRRPLPVRDPGGARSSQPAPPVRSRRSAPDPAARTTVRPPGRTTSSAAVDPVQLSAAVDLLAVAVSAGLSVPGAVAAVGRSGDDPPSRSFARVAAGLERGVPFDRAIRELEVDLGPDTRPLVATLAGATESGAPIGPALQRYAERLRLRHRREVERRIRRLPVLLVIPMCLFVLPAFVVVTVVPVGWTAARQLDPDLLDRR